jgi:hypothetical protein
MRNAHLNSSRSFTLPARDMETWGICIPAVTEQPLVIDSKGISCLPAMLRCMNECHSGITAVGVTVIQTSYDRSHKNNVCFPAKTDRRQNAVWTEGERVKAKAGEIVQDLNDLRSKVCAVEFCNVGFADA